jgi:hypothetical protein
MAVLAGGHFLSKTTCRSLVNFLLNAQCLHRLNRGRAPGWNQSRDKRT